MKCIVIEDQAPAQRVLKKYISEVEVLQLEGVFGSALQALEFLRQNEVDLVFLDINLPRISGIEFLRALNHRPKVILTTAFTEYAVEGYELNVADYLVKPFSFERFVKAVSKVLPEPSPGHVAQSGESDFFIRSGFDYVKVSSGDVEYIHSDMDYTEVHLADRKYLSQDSLQSWETKLNPFGFMRIHRSFLLNTEKIGKISGNRVFTISGAELPIGRAYKEGFLARVLK